MRLIKNISEDDFGFGIFFEIDDDAKALAIGFIANFSDAIYLFAVTNLVKFIDNGNFDRFIRNLSDDDLFLPFFVDYLRFGRYFDATATGFINALQAITFIDEASRRKIRAFDKTHQIKRHHIDMGQAPNDGIHDFAKIVRRNFSC